MVVSSRIYFISYRPNLTCIPVQSYNSENYQSKNKIIQIYFLLQRGEICVMHVSNLIAVKFYYVV